MLFRSVPFVAQAEYALGYDDANGYLITEFGLFTGNGTLLARKTDTGINKTSDNLLTLIHRIRV